MQEIKNESSGIHYLRGYRRGKKNPQVYTTQEGIGEIKNNPQVCTTQEGTREIKNESLGIHYSRRYRRD